MEKGISYFFGYKVGAKNLAKLIKDAGFDSVITSADKRFNFSLKLQYRQINGV